MQLLQKMHMQDTYTKDLSLSNTFPIEKLLVKCDVRIWVMQVPNYDYAVGKEMSGFFYKEVENSEI